MLIKSRTPGPRAKFLDLPAIPYGSEHKPMGFPIFNTVTVFSFSRSDVSMIAQLVHCDIKKHLQQKEEAREIRSERARTKRVKAFKINYHQDQLEITTGATSKRHVNRMSVPLLMTNDQANQVTGLKELLALDPNEDEDEDGFNEFGCHSFCYHDIGLCDSCGDVPGYSHEWCIQCDTVRMDRRFEQYYSKVAEGRR